MNENISNTNKSNNSVVNFGSVTESNKASFVSSTVADGGLFGSIKKSTDEPEIKSKSLFGGGGVFGQPGGIFPKMEANTGKSAGFFGTNTAQQFSIGVKKEKEPVRESGDFFKDDGRGKTEEAPKSTDFLGTTN